MKIVGAEDLTYGEVQLEVDRGAKFVLYQYCVSVVIMTFRRGSNVHFIKADRSRVTAGLPFTLLTFVAGWWGIPWGPIYSVTSLVNNFRGGKDVTEEVMQIMRQSAYQGGAYGAGVGAAPPPLP